MERLSDADPQSVGEFRLRARLGAGGMGQVYLATSPGGRMVAVKVIRQELTGDPEFVRRFQAEVDAARRVSGMYTAPVVAAGMADRSPWLATAFVPGPSLESAVAKYGPLPVPALWRLAAGLADALRAIHATGLVHRDLKPANVLLASDGPRVIDFGIARAVTESRLTATGAIIGTPQFMSPEQVQGELAGPASDVFSLGSVLAFAACGKSPFGVGPEAMPAAVLYRVAHGTPELGAVPPEIRDLVQACLAKDPAWRPDLGQVAARCAAAAEAFGMSPAAFWPPEVVRAIEAQQAAMSTEIATLAPAPQTGSAPWAVPAPGPQTWSGAKQPQPSTHASPKPVLGGISRRRVLRGAGVGGVIAVFGLGSSIYRLNHSGSTPGTAGPDQTAATGLGSAPVSGTGAGGRPVAWTFTTGNEILANPGVANGTVYVGSRDNFLYAVNAATGKQVWKAQQGWVAAAPQVVGTMVLASTAEGMFSALHAGTGAVVWQQQTDSAAAFKPNWAVSGNSVILPSATDPLAAYDIATGSRGRAFGSPGQFAGGSIGAGSGVLYAVQDTGALFALDVATGSSRWQTQVQGSSDGFFASLVVSDGTLYLTDDNGTLYSVSATTGSANWSYPTGGTQLSAPVADDGLVYVTDDGGNLHAVNAATGKQAWTHQAESGGEFGPGLAAGTLYVSTGLTLQALDAKTGDALWAFSLPNTGAITCTPAVAGDLVFIGSTNDNLYAVRA